MVDGWMERRGSLERLTDPATANRWKVVAVLEGEDRT